MGRCPDARLEVAENDDTAFSKDWVVELVGFDI